MSNLGTKFCNKVETSHLDGYWWRGLTECGPLEKGMASHVSMIALRTAQNAPGDQWRNNSRENEGIEPKQKQ